MSKLIKKLDDMEINNSLFEIAIRKLEVPVVKIFKASGAIKPVTFKQEDQTLDTKDSDAVKRAFYKTCEKTSNKVLRAMGTNNNPAKGMKVAVLFSGGPAAGGHNVICGLKQALGSENTLLGVKAGPKGLLAGNFFEITDSGVERILNTGGFDFLGSDRTKIKTSAQFDQVRTHCKKNNINGLVVIGGDDSNTNAAVLAEFLYDDKIQVIGVPKTIDGDLQVGDLMPVSFGFDTATKIYSELVGNILQDTPSSRKYWHFIKLMGRSASHVALEVALQTNPAICLISEEVQEKQMSLAQIVEEISRIVIDRAKNKKINHGVVVIPEGIIEFIPEMRRLIDELNNDMAQYRAQMDGMNLTEKHRFVQDKLSEQNSRLYASLPVYIQDMLMLERDSHGNLQVSQIPTERLLINMVRKRIKELDGSVPFGTNSHFFGYEGRCGAPSLFDAAFTFNLGLTAASLILDGHTGYMAAVSDFDKGGSILAIPLTGLLNIERRQGNDEMVIEKALVTLDSPAFRYFESRRKIWASEDRFTSPGPRQMWGPVSNQIPMTVALNRGYNDLNFNF